MDEMGWYDEVVMVYGIGFINSRLLGFCYCCFVVMFLFVVGCFDFVIVVMIYGIEYRLFYNLLYCLCCFVFSLLLFVVMIYVIVFYKVLIPCLWY